MEPPQRGGFPLVSYGPTKRAPTAFGSEAVVALDTAMAGTDIVAWSGEVRKKSPDLVTRKRVCLVPTQFGFPIKHELWSHS